MAKGIMKIIVINYNDNQQTILNIAVSVKYRTKLLKILIKSASQNNFFSTVLKNNLKNSEIRKYIKRNFWIQKKFLRTNTSDSVIPLVWLIFAPLMNFAREFRKTSQDDIKFYLTWALAFVALFLCTTINKIIFRYMIN